jgi:hypothetical protein
MIALLFFSEHFFGDTQGGDNVTTARLALSAAATWTF